MKGHIIILFLTGFIVKSAQAQLIPNGMDSLAQSVVHSLKENQPQEYLKHFPTRNLAREIVHEGFLQVGYDDSSVTQLWMNKYMEQYNDAIVKSFTPLRTHYYDSTVRWQEALIGSIDYYTSKDKADMTLVRARRFVLEGYDKEADQLENLTDIAILRGHKIKFYPDIKKQIAQIDKWINNVHKNTGIMSLKKLMQCGDSISMYLNMTLESMEKHGGFQYVQEYSDAKDKLDYIMKKLESDKKSLNGFINTYDEIVNKKDYDPDLLIIVNSGGGSNRLVLPDVIHTTSGWKVLGRPFWAEYN